MTKNINKLTRTTKLNVTKTSLLTGYATILSGVLGFAIYILYQLSQQSYKLPNLY